MAALQDLILNLRAEGIPLLLLWVLTMAVVYGILSHIDMPKSKVVRGTISIVAAFMVLFAAASGPAVQFVENIMVSGLVIAFALFIVMIFLEISGAKKDGAHIFAVHPKFFGIALIVLLILIFIGAGGLGLLNIPAITIGNPTIAILFFVAIMVVTIWILMKEGKEGK
ncbi:MAG: hypothetical protein KJ906_00315 [Nanoarchaeota archaeon]|nr:hypothetical protein [Nanoarchaeota archaeon]